MFRKVSYISRNDLLIFNLHRNCSIASETKLLSGLILEREHIDGLIKLKPALASVDHNMWHKTHGVFLNHGLNTTNFVQIIAGNPAILTRPRKKIISSLEHWRSVQFGEKLLSLLLTKHPTLLNVTDGDMLRTQLTFLKGFACTNKNVWQLLMNCPKLMTQDEEAIQEKIDYLKTEMRVEVPEIVKSEALANTLDHIRHRHVLLLRLGLFKPRSIRAEANAKTTNHRLYQITDTSEKSFATKICHVTLEEFECFKELHCRELYRKRYIALTDTMEKEDD